MTGEAHDPTSNLAERTRELRTQRGWSLRRLAEQASVSTSMLSQVERGTANPTVGVALGIARALGVTLDELLQVRPAEPRITVIRGDDPFFVYRSDSACRIRTLSQLRSDRSLEFYEITLQGGAELRSAPHVTGTIEYVAVQSGAVRIESGTSSVDLSSGDSCEYPADVAHAIVNRRKSAAVVYLIDSGLSSTT